MGRHLGRDAIHTYWDNGLPPRLTIEPGETVLFETREPSQGGVARDNLSDASADSDPSLLSLAVRDAAVMPAPRSESDPSGHALTGPVAIHGAEPGDTLVVEVL